MKLYKNVKLNKIFIYVNESSVKPDGTPLKSKIHIMMDTKNNLVLVTDEVLISDYLELNISVVEAIINNAQ